MARLVTALLQRSDHSAPWGFRIQGGADYNVPLSVQRVTPGSLASQQLTAGDVLIMIDGQDARSMCHFDACELIKSAGTNVELIVRKANSKYLFAENFVQQEKLEQQIVEERYRQEEEKQQRKATREALSPPYGSQSPTSNSLSAHSNSPGYASPGTKAMSPLKSQDFHGDASQCYDVVPVLSGQHHSAHKYFQVPQTHFHHSQDHQVPQVESTSRTCQPIVQSTRTAFPIAPPQSLTPNLRLFSEPSSNPVQQMHFPMSPPVVPLLSKTAFPPTSHQTYDERTSTQQSLKSQERNSSPCVAQSKHYSNVKPLPVYSTTFSTQPTFNTFGTQSGISPYHPTQSQGVSNLSRDHLQRVRTSSQTTTSPVVSEVGRSSFSPQRTRPLVSGGAYSQTHSLSTTSPQLSLEGASKPEKITQSAIQFRHSGHTKNTNYEQDTYHQSPMHHSYSPQVNSPPFHDDQKDIEDTENRTSNYMHQAQASALFPQMLVFSSQPFQSTRKYQEIGEDKVNPQLLSARIQTLQLSEDKSSSSQSSTHVGAVGHEDRRSQSRERESLGTEEFKQRQLQKLIEEKVRLEEMMMIAKRRQSISETNEPRATVPEPSKEPISNLVHKKELGNRKKEPSPSCMIQKEKDTIFSPPLSSYTKDEEQIRHMDSQKDIVSKDKSPKISSEQINISHPMPLVQMTPTVRQEDEEEKLRHDNTIRDEKIRRMQERRYEEKLKRNVLRSARERSCPPDTGTDQKSQTESKESKGRKSRDRTRAGAKGGRLARDRSCPDNLGQRSEARPSKPEEKVEKEMFKEQSSLASAFISEHLKRMNIGDVKSNKHVLSFDETSKVQTELKNIKHQDLARSMNSDTNHMKPEDPTLNCIQSQVKSLEFKGEIIQHSQIKQQNEIMSSDQFEQEAQRWHTELSNREQFIKNEEARMYEQLHHEQSTNHFGNLAREEINFTENNTIQQLNASCKSWQTTGTATGLNVKQPGSSNTHYQTDSDKPKQIDLKQMEQIEKHNKGEIGNYGNKELQEKYRQAEANKNYTNKRKNRWEPSHVGTGSVSQEFRHSGQGNVSSQVSGELLSNEKMINLLAEEQMRREEEEQRIWQEQEEQVIKQEQDQLRQEYEEQIRRQEQDRLRQEYEDQLKRQEQEEQFRRHEQEQQRKWQEQEELKRRNQQEEQIRREEQEKQRMWQEQQHRRWQEEEQRKKDQRNQEQYKINQEKEEQRIRGEREEELRIEDLRRQEEEKMREEAKLYEQYKDHLENKRNVHMYDSDDYASECDTGGEDEEGKKVRGVYLKETFDELKATSEEELFDAQEKSIRNLERQLRKQKQKEIRKNFEKRHHSSAGESNKVERRQKPPFHASSQRRHYSSTGDLRSSNPSRTLPVIKFSPDPMEFGFRPIETPQSTISRSVGNLMTGGGPSASSIAHVAGAEAGVAAIRKPISRKIYYEEKYAPQEAWDSGYRISSSLEDLQQVSRKPPLPLQSKLRTSKLRHATSEEMLSNNGRPSYDPRRHTYTEGEDFSELAYVDSLNLGPMDFEKLLHEYYAAYYGTYYQSYYKRQQTDVREGKMMNLGPPPPPPPPPFSTGTPAPPKKAPAPVQAPVEVPTRGPPVVAPPAALAGAMMKDKKPFTYTPGGINLAEIKSPRMQRRLQRNASLEGVRPSPLAQQPPPSPGGTGAAASVSAPRMIQVLPVPGMAMVPVEKPKVTKEPPKVNRKSCGPAPPPPPFALVGENGVNKSPSATPTAPSYTPPSTPSTFSSSLSSLSTNSFENAPPKNELLNLQTNNARSDLVPAMASEPGPSVPTPPPPLPSSEEKKKRYSCPTMPCPSSFGIKVENEEPKLTQPPSTLSNSIPSLISQEEHQPISPKVQNTNSKIESSPTSQNEDNASKDLQSSSNDTQGASHKNVNNDAYAGPNTDAKTSELKNADTKQEKQVSQAQPRDIKEKAVENNTENLTNKDLSLENIKNTDEVKVETNKQNQEVHNDSSDKITDSELTKESKQVQNSFQEVKNSAEHFECETESHAPKQISPATTTTPVQNFISKGTPPRPSSTKSSSNTSPVHRTFSSKPVASEPSSTANHIDGESQRFRTLTRMISPPASKDNQENQFSHDRLIRQSSLPNEPSSPSSGVKSMHKNLSHIQFGKHSSFDESDNHNAPGFPNSTSNSAATCLSKGPLPWMCGVKKDASPPPEFLIQAQKTQERLQKQRSLVQREIPKECRGGVHANENNVNSNPQYVHNSPHTPMSNAQPGMTTSPLSPQQAPQNHTWRSQDHQQKATPNQPKNQRWNQQPNYSQPLSPKMKQDFPEFSPTITQNNQSHERIIPILLEDSPPVTPSTTGKGFVANRPNQFNQAPLNRQGPLTNSGTPMGNGSAFVPYDQGNYPSSSNALEALQQMQQNLAQLNSGLQTAQHPSQANGLPNANQPVGYQEPVTQSRSFRILQNAYDHLDTMEPPEHYQQDVQPEMKKYTGSNIPSRSFRILQAMTDTDEVQPNDTSELDRQKKTLSNAGSNSSVLGNTVPSCSFSSSSLSSTSPTSTISTISMTSSANTPSMTPTSYTATRSKDPAHRQLSDDTSSGVAPSYTSTSDSPVYRHVIPKILPTSKGNGERVVNSALSARRDDSPRPWHGSASTAKEVSKSLSPSKIVKSSQHPSTPTVHESDKNEEGEAFRLYGGGNIPSRVFKMIQNDYSDEHTNSPNDTSNDHRSRSMTPSARVTEVHIPRFMQQLNIDPKTSSREKTQEDHENEVLETASAKVSVLKELSSHFDPQTTLKKPRAAPGRVFKYLQEQYDDPSDSDFASTDSLSNYQNESNSISPSNTTIRSSSSGFESGRYDIEPKPYDGNRIPGRTFKLLQDNIGTHPSVLQARK